MTGAITAAEIRTMTLPEVRARLDEIADECADLDAQIVALIERRDALNADGARLRKRLPKQAVPKPAPTVLVCTDCIGVTFPVGTVLTDFLRHTVEKHGRRPTMAERVPVQL